MKAYWGSGCIAPRIVDLGTRWRWVVSFTPRPLYPQGRSPWYPLDRRLGGPQSRSGRGGVVVAVTYKKKLVKRNHPENCKSQRYRGLRRTLGSRYRIPLETWTFTCYRSILRCFLMLRPWNGLIIYPICENEVWVAAGQRINREKYM
jgi:hypothetical protein